MHPQNTLALSKAIGDKVYKAAREQLGAGNHEVDFTVRVTGQLLIGADTDKTPTVSIPLKETLALFIRYCGVTREKAVQFLGLAMADALESGARGQGAIAEAMPVVEETIERVLQPMLEKLPRTPVKGSVRSELTVIEIETPELTVALEEKRPKRRRRA